MQDLDVHVLDVDKKSGWNLCAGAPSPLGPSDNGDGINFAIFSKHASMIALCLFNENRELMAEVDLDPAHHKTGTVKGLRSNPVRLS